MRKRPAPERGRGTENKGVKMAWDESKAWLSGSNNGKLYETLLQEATDLPKRNAQRNSQCSRSKLV